MTKYWLFAILFLALASCQKDEAEATPWVCSPCGTYSITFDATITDLLPNVDTTFYNLPGWIYISLNSKDEIGIQIERSAYNSLVYGDSIHVQATFLQNADWLKDTLSVFKPTQFLDEIYFIATFSNDYQEITGSYGLSSMQSFMNFQGTKQ